MSTAVTARSNGQQLAAGEIERVLIKGDLSKLNEEQRNSYYLKVCDSLGLNPLTRPMEYMVLNNKLVLYVRRDGTDQLRKIHNISVEDLTESDRDGVYIVTAKVRNDSGRSDIAKGAVTIASLKGDALANAMMKCETKAKRRATLSICGLGFLDETELETIPASARAPAKPAPVEIAKPAAPLPPHDPETGEILDDDPYLGRRLTKPAPIDADDWIKFGEKYIAAVKGCKSLSEANDWYSVNQSKIDQMRHDAPKVYARLSTAVAKLRAAIATDADMADVGAGDIMMAG